MSSEHFPTINDGLEQLGQSAELWLADLRATIPLTPQDEAFLDYLAGIDQDSSVLATRQHLRQLSLDSAGHDIIEHQFNVLKNVFGPKRT